MNHETILSAIIAGLFSVATVTYVAWDNRRVRQVGERDEADAERQRLEAEAYKRARDSYESALTTATNQISRLEARMEACERRATLAERRADEAEKRSDRLATTVRALRAELVRAGIDIPGNLAGD